MLTALKLAQSRPLRAYNAPPTFVQSGLAVTPSEMIHSAELGIPISSNMANKENFNEGVAMSVNDWSVPAHRQRGVDFSDAYVIGRNAGKKISNVITTINQTT